MKETFSDSPEGMLGLAGSAENKHLSKSLDRQELSGWNKEHVLMARNGRFLALCPRKGHRPVDPFK